MKVTFKRLYYICATPFVCFVLINVLDAMFSLRGMDGLGVLLFLLMCLGISILTVHRLEPIVLRPEDRR